MFLVEWFNFVVHVFRLESNLNDIDFGGMEKLSVFDVLKDLARWNVSTNSLWSKSHIIRSIGYSASDHRRRRMRSSQRIWNSTAFYSLVHTQAVSKFEQPSFIEVARSFKVFSPCQQSCYLCIWKNWTFSELRNLTYVICKQLLQIYTRCIKIAYASRIHNAPHLILKGHFY